MLQSPSRAVILFGTDEAPAKVHSLSAGPLTAELQNGELRHLSYGGIEVLRGISFLIRDSEWATYAPEITNLAIDEENSGFRVIYDGRCADGHQDFRYHAEIVARPNGDISFEVMGRAETQFLTNRLGFVVLHPLDDVVGEPVEVTHTDGSVEQTTFPRLIKPDQPICDIRALTHSVAASVRATCTMLGDAYEMEDQRNWTDASFKTYIRPLSKPRPYTLAGGTELAQSVSLEFSGTHSPATQIPDGDSVQVRVGAAVGPQMPSIGVAVAAEFSKATVAQSERVKELSPQFLVCEFDARRDDIGVMEDYRELCAAVDAGAILELILAADDDPFAEATVAAAIARQANFRPDAVSVFPAPYMQSYQPEGPWPDIPPFSSYYSATRAAFPGCAIGGGMFGFFTELNRARVGRDDGLDYITHTTCAIVHDADDRAVMETLEALPHVIASTREFSGGVPYRIGPSAIGMRYRPYGPVPPLDNPDNIRLAMAGSDPRQSGLFGASWNLGYIAQVASLGIDAVALSAVLGPTGIVHHAANHDTPYFGGGPEGTVFPVFHIIAGMAAGAGKPVLEAQSSDMSRVACVSWQGKDGPELWLANLRDIEQDVSVSGIGDGVLAVEILDADSFERVTAASGGFRGNIRTLQSGTILRMDSYSVARITPA